MEQFPLAIIVERRRLQNRWVSEQWEVVGVVPALPATDAGDSANGQPQQIFADEERTQYRVDGLGLELFRDEAENYYLNLSSPEPRVFVMWRLENDFARPVVITVSYGEAARMLDAGEQVDGVPMPLEVAGWLGEFVRIHYKPEPRRKVRRNDPFAATTEGAQPRTAHGGHQ